MNRDRLSAIAHRAHPVAAPFSDATVDAILRWVTVRSPSSVLDIGCGAGSWLVPLLARLPAASGVGVDVSEVAVRDARTAAKAAGVGDRVEFRCADAATALRDAGSYDAVLCIGSTHALGGLAPALRAMAQLTRPGGCLVVADGFWEREPDSAALDALGATPDEFPTFAGIVDAVSDGGLLPAFGHRSSREEWDDYEWAWTSSLALWASENPADEDAADATAWADEHRREWLHGYCDVLGFAAVAAVRPPSS